MRTDKRFILSLAFVVLVGAIAAQAQVDNWKDIKTPPLRPFKIERPKVVTLSNGMTIYLMEDHELPLISGTAVIRGGSRDEAADKTGLASLFGEVWRTGGTKTKTGDELDDYLEARAARVETGADADSTSVSFNALKGDFDDVFKVFDDLLRNPEFRADKLGLAKTQANTGISRRNDDPMGIANRESNRLGYGPDYPYVREPEYWTIAAVTRDDLSAWHSQWVHPNNIILGVIGDFDSKKMEAKLRKAFSSWKKGPAAKPFEATLKEPDPGIYFIPKEDVNQSSIRFVHVGTRRDNPDYHALEVMNEVFGGGFAARLFSNVRSKKGLAYQVGGGVGMSYDHPGLFRLVMGTKSESTAAAIDALLEEIDNLHRNPATQEELNRAKDSILNSFVFRYDSKQEILYEQMALAFYGYPADFLERYRSGIEKVTAEDVARVSKQYVHKDRLAILVVGKAADFDRPLSSFGPVKTIDITIHDEKPGAKAAAAPTGSDAAARATIDLVMKAHGGREKVATIKSLRSTGTLNMKTPQGDMAIEIDVVNVFPTQMVQKMTTPMGDMVVVLNGDGSFMKSPMGSRELPPSQKDGLIKESKRSPHWVLQHVDDPAFTFTDGGTEKVGDVDTRVVLINADGAEATWCVDPASGRILRLKAKTVGMAGPAEQVTDFSDWKDVEGVSVAFTRKLWQNGEEAGSVVIKTYELNPKVDMAVFEKPATN